jgi:cbb3-type cytochrome oxidase maturation protein
MDLLLIFAAAGLVLFVAALLALTWAVRSGQMDDLDTPAMRVLTDDRENLP